MSSYNINKLEQELADKSKNSDRAVLSAQWEFDRRLIANALKAVPMVFPNYSLHDESHSLTILTNIIKLLGENELAALTCTDLWLILEAAYCHDLGMLVSAEKLNEVIESGEFRNHLLKISADTSHPYQKYTTKFNFKAGIRLENIAFDAEFIDAAKFLLSDFFRTKHADYSKEIVLNPRAEFNLDSPRSLIPARLFNIIADICKAHGEAFDFVMQLPCEENGVGTDNCHPRFVACLLRFGDLLDLDNDRFSEPLLKTIATLPSDSQLHYRKHKSITHFLLTPKELEVEAYCENPDIATVTQKWFDMIKDEITQQTLEWDNILPNEYKFTLPSINSLNVKVDGYEIINGQKKERFNIDSVKAFELIQGRNLYKNTYEPLREILQNAIDSTMLRIYLDYKKDNQEIVYSEQFLADIKEKYEIIISYQKEANGDYTVEITDQGIGLKTDQLTYLINAGSSSKNTQRNAWIAAMPEWFRPSGIFGIGFQSIFLLTDKVELLGRDYFEHKCIHLELYNPNSSMKGAIYSRKVKDNYKVGLTVRFKLKAELLNAPPIAPFKVDLQDDKFQPVIEKLSNYGELSFVQIKIKNKAEPANIIFKKRPEFYFDRDENVEIKFENEEIFASNKYTASIYYRNSLVSSSNLHIPFLNCKVNILAGDSKTYLSLDRNSFNKHNKIKEKIQKVISRFHKTHVLNTQSGYIKENTDYLFKLNDAYQNVFKKSYSVPVALDNLTFTCVTESGEEKIKISEIFTEKVKKINFILGARSGFKITKISNCEITFEASLMPVLTHSFMIDLAMLIFKYANSKFDICICKKISLDGVFNNYKFVFSDNEEIVNSVELNLALILREIKGARSLSFVNYIKGYEEIRIPSSKSDPKICNRLSNIDNYFEGQKIEKILCPIISKNEKYYDIRNDEFYEYVRTLNGQSIDEIKKAYDRLMEQ